MNALSALATRFAFGGALALLLLGLDRLLHRRVHAGETARAIVDGGRVLGVFLVSGALVSSAVAGESLLEDLKWLLLDGALAGLLFSATSRIGGRLLLRSSVHEQLSRGNSAAALAVAGHTVATAILVAANAGGTDLSTLGIGAAFFALSILTLHLFVALFRALTSYDDAEQIEDGNHAAALSYAGITVALALIIGHAAEGTFEGWAASLQGYGTALVSCLSLYLVRQLVVQTVLCGARPTLRRGPLDEAIGARRDLGLAVLEAAAYLGCALLVGQLS
jgi:uncharacterized membrane protein YjfL (UPF0719 family)